MSTDNARETTCSADRMKLQFEYGWRWFEYHARQRISMFNYVLLITGILANAYVASYKEGYTEVAVAIALLGFYTSVGFVFLDIRNHALVKEGENVLEKLEGTIFGQDIAKGSEQALAPFAVERTTKMREGGKAGLRTILKHKFWIRSLEGIVAACFLLGAILAVTKPCPSQ